LAVAYEGAGPDFVAMVDHEDWVLRPVLRGLCKYESLLDGTLTLEDVDLLNEALDVEAENHFRSKPKKG
jgi:hypothetical protein